MNSVPCLIRLKNAEVIHIQSPVFHIGTDIYLDYQVTNNSNVSEQHAKLIYRDGTCYIVDLNSVQGTWLNGEKIERGVEYPLTYGDKVCLADEAFEYQQTTVHKPMDPMMLKLILQDGLTTMQQRIECPGADPDTINQTFHQILLDNPMMCHFEGEWSWEGAVIPVYTLSKLHREMLSRRVDRLMQELPRNNESVLETARIIYCWLCENITYDRHAPYGQNAYGALVERRAVCKGIAKAYQLLLNRMQIPCCLVEGTLDGETKHVWNLFYAEGKWYHSDVTMYYPQFQFVHQTGKPYAYQAIDAQELVRTHTIWNLERLPKGARGEPITLKKVVFQSLEERSKEAPQAPDHLPASILSYIQGGLAFVEAGSISDVWRAFGKTGTVALKRIRCGLDMTKFYYAMRECAMLQKAQGKSHLVKLLCFDVVQSADGFTVYLLMEDHTPLPMVCGQTELVLGDALRIALEACRALQQCYDAGVAHLDIQPGNLLISADGTVKLTDFSSAVPSAEVRSMTQLRGTQAYLAPEVFQYQYTQAGDVYAMGILLYSLLQGGKLPFGENQSVREATIRRLNGEPIRLSTKVPENVRKCVEKACSYSVAERYSDIHAFVNELELLLKHYGSTGETEFVKTARRLANTISPVCFGMPPAPAHTPVSFNIPAPCIPNPPQPVSVMPMRPPVVPRGWLEESEHKPVSQSVVRSGSVRRRFLADSIGESTVLGSYQPQTPAPVPEQEPVKMDKVQFSAIAPKKAIKGEYTLVQLYMYEQEFRSAVEEALEMMDVPAQEKKSGLYQVKDQTRVKVVLSSADVEIVDDTVEELWSGGYLTFDFALDIPVDCAKRQILLKASVFFDDIPATRLLLTLPLQSQHDQKLELMRSDVLKAFVSYASQDRSRVGALVQGMRKARPDMDIFLDVENLHSGDQWENILYSRIDQSDTLFLCWSRNAQNSPWVDKEWRYALATKGIDSIEPIPIDPPTICPPPQELSAKHFNDCLLYIINNS